MEFVKVRHPDGRSADITPGEIPMYRSIGFKPVDGSITTEVDASGSPVVEDAPLSAVNGTDQRLDLVLEELRGLRADLAAAWAPEVPTEPEDGEPIQLREPSTGKPADPPAQAPINLDQMNRDDLNAHAAAIGVPDPASFANKSSLIEAIKAAHPTQP